MKRKNIELARGIPRKKNRRDNLVRKKKISNKSVSFASWRTTVQIMTLLFLPANVKEVLKKYI